MVYAQSRITGFSSGFSRLLVYRCPHIVQLIPTYSFAKVDPNAKAARLPRHSVSHPTVSIEDEVEGPRGEEAG